MLVYNRYVDKKRHPQVTNCYQQLATMRHKGFSGPLMTCECRLCVAILARIMDTCQGLYPLMSVEGADFLFTIFWFCTLSEVQAIEACGGCRSGSATIESNQSEL